MVLVVFPVTSFKLEDLFVGAPEMQQLVRLLEEPGVIEVLFQSANTKQVGLHQRSVFVSVTPESMPLFFKFYILY